jgi:poly-gamma-glutamate synthesis protein (capsule biosynthesis protein)
MDESTLAAFTLLWGAPGPQAVRSLPREQLLETAWAGFPSWAIVPFEALTPRWKVLSVDGKSPVRKDFTLSGYPLVAYFRLHADNPTQFTLPETNRAASRMTTLILTGVTALVRATAYTMEIKGILYPGRDIRDWMLEADLAHISNEIPFYGSCAQPNPNQSSLVFCSSTRYIDLLTDIGTDVVELTGNHFGDYGPQAMQDTVSLYEENGIAYYGGGMNRQAAIQPLLIENNGNRLAFIGCNKPDTGGKPTATDQRPGAAPCEFDYMTGQIRQLRDQGYVVVTTFQWNESATFSHVPFVFQIDDFRLMADAGAAIVSGSQAHAPQTMEFYGEAFIHYGLGNLFFDQMGKLTGQSEFNRWGFMDRYVIYDGRVVSVELLTTILEDYSRPRPMTQTERARFLQLYFTESGWLTFAPSPTPEATPTLTPLSLPAVVGGASGFLPATPTITP